MDSVQKVWVLAENQANLAQLCAGARQLGKEVAVVMWGTGDDAGKAISWGADRVYLLGLIQPDRRHEDYLETILELVKKETPELIMVQSSKRGKLMAGRLAANLGTSVLVDAAEIFTADGRIRVRHMVYGGAAFRTEQALTKPAIVTVGAGVFRSLPEDTARQGVVVTVDFLEPATRVKRLEIKAKGTVAVNLAAAKRVVGIGRGIAKQEDIKMVEEIAALLEAEIGCSRPIAEGLNWLPRERYIGVSGAMLKPELYFAVGISGQVQHMVGANRARVIVAINRDKAAPIFKQADYGIVGDLYKVLPLLIKKLKASRQ